MEFFPFVWTLWGSFKAQLDFFSIADWTNADVGSTDRTNLWSRSPEPVTTVPG